MDSFYGVDGIDKSLSFPFVLGSVSQQPVFPGLRSPTRCSQAEDGAEGV